MVECTPWEPGGQFDSWSGHMSGVVRAIPSSLVGIVQEASNQ